MKPCDRGRGNSILLVKVAVKVIQFVRKSSVGSGSILGRRLIVGYIKVITSTIINSTVMFFVTLLKNIHKQTFVTYQSITFEYDA